MRAFCRGIAFGIRVVQWSLVAFEAMLLAAAAVTRDVGAVAVLLVILIVSVTLITSDIRRARRLRDLQPVPYSGRHRPGRRHRPAVVPPPVMEPSPPARHVRPKIDA